MREQKVIDFYLICHRLKDTIRSGWKDWKVQKDRLESVAEHIYSTQMLAIAVNSEFKYNLDMYKVIYLIAIHELGETIIGDVTPFEMDRKEKKRIEHEAVHNLLSTLVDKEELESLFIDFDDCLSDEARFAKQCDKLECCLQAKLYDQDKLIDLTKQDDNSTFLDEEVQSLLNNGNSFSDMWLKWHKEHDRFDDNFKQIIDYMISNGVFISTDN